MLAVLRIDLGSLDEGRVYLLARGQAPRQPVEGSCHKVTPGRKCRVAWSDAEALFRTPGARLRKDAAAACAWPCTA